MGGSIRVLVETTASVSGPMALFVGGVGSVGGLKGILVKGWESGGISIRMHAEGLAGWMRVLGELLQRVYCCVEVLGGLVARFSNNLSTSQA